METLIDSPPAETPSQESAPPAETPSPDALTGPWINQDGSFVPDWTSRAGDPDLQEPSLKDFKSVKDLARSYVHTKRMVGQKGIIPPTEKSTPQEVAEYRKAIGAPENDAGYQISSEGLPEGAQISQELAGKFRSIANKHHMPQYVWKELSDAFLDVEKQRFQIGQQQQLDQLQKVYTDGVNELKRSWGRDYEINLDKVKAIANHPDVAVPLDSPGFRDPEVVKAFLRLGAKISDDQFVGSTSGRTAASDPEQEAMRIVSDSNHADYHRYHKGDPDVQARVEALFAAGERRRQLARGF